MAMLRTIGATILYLAFVAVATSGSAETPPASADVRLALDKIPVFFVPNRGQADSAVRFLGRSPGGTLLLYDNASLVVTTASGIVLRQSPVGGSRTVRVSGAEPLGGKSHFFLGRLQDQWQTDVPHFSRIIYRDVYPGIDLIYHGNAGALQYEWTVAPGVDPGSITLAMEGSTRTRLDEAGHLLLDTATGTMRIARPVAFQVIGGRRRGVEAAYVLDPPGRVRYAIGAHDPGVPLVIDPIIQASTYLGGDGPDHGYDIAVDSQRNVYVTGETRSPNFPLKNQVAGPGGDYDVFVAKLDPTLSALIYSTYIGGGGWDRGQSIAVDPQGNAYVTGFTRSSNFPVTSGVIDTTCGSDGACNPGNTPTSTFQRSDVFIVKLTSGGQLAYSTYVGDSGSDSGNGIAVDALGTAYVTGYTQSGHFPTTTGVFQPQCKGVSGCSQDAFVLRINNTASGLIYSTFLGGSSVDTAYSIAIAVSSGPSSNIYITGSTQSADFPTTAGAFQPQWSGGGTDAFVTKLDAQGRTLFYSTFLGGSDYDDARGVAVDAYGAAYVIGQTGSANFPTMAALDATCGTDGACNVTGNQKYVDVFVSKLNPQGSALVYSTFLGGSFIEFAGGIAVDGSYNAFVTGETTSPDFPVVDGVLVVNGGADAFVARLNGAGNALTYSTYLSGYASDAGNAIAVDAQSNAYVTGGAGPAFPTTGGAFQPAFPGTSLTGVAFVTRIGEPGFGKFWVLVAAGALLVLVGVTMMARRRRRSPVTSANS